MKPGHFQSHRYPSHSFTKLTADESDLRVLVKSTIHFNLSPITQRRNRRIWSEGTHVGTRQSTWSTSKRMKIWTLSLCLVGMCSKIAQLDSLSFATLSFTGWYVRAHADIEYGMQRPNPNWSHWEFVWFNRKTQFPGLVFYNGFAIAYCLLPNLLHPQVI